MALKQEQSLGDLFSDLSSGTSTLVRQEMQLAKAEVMQKASEAGKHVGFIAAGGALAYAGLLALLAALTLGLAEFMPGWLAALLVGLVVAGIGGLVAYSGLNSLQQMDAKPERTIKSLQEDKQWLQQQLQ